MKLFLVFQECWSAIVVREACGKWILLKAGVYNSEEMRTTGFSLGCALWGRCEKMITLVGRVPLRCYFIETINEQPCNLLRHKKRLLDVELNS